jgi:uncharacterized protein (TIGR03435 family)
LANDSCRWRAHGSTLAGNKSASFFLQRIWNFPVNLEKIMNELIAVEERASSSLKRIEVNMQSKLESRRIVRYITAGMAILTVLVSLSEPPLGRAQSQAGATAPQAQAGAPQSFEVASIKPSAPAENGMFMVMMGNSPGGRWTAKGVTTSILIQQAYDVKDFQISGGPSWLNSERYDIVAKADTPNITREMLKVLLQSLLAERFNLKFHRDTKELPIYALVVGKNGHKLHASEIQPNTQGDAQAANPSKPGQTGGGTGGAVEVAGAPVKSGSQIRMGRGQLNAQMTPVSAIAAMLAQQLGRPVIDKTDIKGNFDFSLQWTPDETQRGIGFGGMEKPATDSPLPSDPTSPSIFTAVQEQLGLRLEATKGPVEILVIDRIEKASGN